MFDMQLMTEKISLHMFLLSKLTNNRFLLLTITFHKTFITRKLAVFGSAVYTRLK